MRKWTTLLAIALALISDVAASQTPVWTRSNIGVSRNTSPPQIGVDIGTSSSSFTSMGSIIGGQFVPSAMPIATVFSDSSGATDTASAINALTSAGNITAVLPCGTYRIDSRIAMANRTVLDGQGCATIKPSASLALDPMVNAIPGAPGTNHSAISNKDVAGNSDIQIRGLTIDGTNAPPNTHLAFFYKSSNVKVENNKGLGPGTGNVQDFFAFVQSSNFVVARNYCSGIRNACYDQWDGSSNFQITDNIADGGGQMSYGILINGLSTSYAINTTYNGTVRGNIIRNVTDVGIWAGGLYDSGSGHYGATNNMTIAGNVVDTSALHGILVSDGSGNVVNANVVRNTGQTGIRVGSQNAGTTDQTIISANVVSNTNTSAGSYGAVQVVSGASNTVISNNTVSGTMHTYAVHAAAGTTNTSISCGRMAAGTTGTVIDAGSGGMKSCYDGSTLQITSPGAVGFGIAGFDAQVIIDAGGNLTPAAVNRALGNTTYYWQSGVIQRLQQPALTIATLPTCNSTNQAMRAVVSNGVTVGTSGYGASVSTTGSAMRAVFCDGSGWAYN